MKRITKSVREVSQLLRTPEEGQARRADNRFEVQFHPGDIQARVRYFFLSRLQLAGVLAALLLFVSYLVMGVLLSPGVVKLMMSQGQHQSLLATRAQLGDRLGVINRQLQELKMVSDDLQLRMNKIYLAYGLENDDSIGQGGYPLQVGEVPESVYAEQISEIFKLETNLREQAGVLSAFLSEIQLFEQDHEGQVSSTPSLSPLQGDRFVLTSPFGNRKNPFTKGTDFHAGIDLSAPTGTPVYAPADGVISFAGRYDARRSLPWWRYGNLVSIRNGDRFVTLFGHLHEVKVKRGQRVEQGDLIGTVGNTGWSTNPHLHYEVRRLDDGGDFKPVDPRVYILDHRWSDEEKLLVRARSAPDMRSYEPLPRTVR